MDLRTKYLIILTGFFIILFLIPTVILVCIKLFGNKGEDGSNDKKIISGRIGDEEKKKMSKQNLKQNELLKETASKEILPQTNLTQENAPQEDAPGSSPVQETISQEDAPENIPVQETIPQEDAPGSSPVQEIISFNNSEQESSSSQETLIHELTPLEPLSQVNPSENLELHEEEKADLLNLQTGLLNSFSTSQELIELYEEEKDLYGDFVNNINKLQHQEEEEEVYETASEDQSASSYENCEPFALKSY